MKILRLLLATVILSFVTQTLLAKPSYISVATFFKNDDFIGLQLSPNGKNLAVISSVFNRRNIVLFNMDDLSKPIPLTNYNRYDVGSYFWANDDTIVFKMDQTGGREALTLLKVDINGKRKVRQLVAATFGSSGVRMANVVNTLAADPDNIIVSYNGRRAKYPDLFKLPIDSEWSDKRKKNRKMKLLAKNPGDVVGWLVDNDGNVRGAQSTNGLIGTIYYKDIGEKDFRVVKKYKLTEENYVPVGFDFDNKTLYAMSNIGRDTNGLYTLDTKTFELDEMIFGDDEVDVGGMIFSRKRNKLLGVTYFNDYPQVKYFDKEEEQLRKSLLGAFPGKQVNFTSRSKDEMLNIVYVGNDQDPGNYYLFDRNTNKMKWLLPVRKSINPKDMSPMKPFKFTSRDGLNIRGYITIPKHTDGKMLPLIINPHGGPFGIRDYWGYNAEHQFFANRGYATVQVTYRGSGGYGRKFEQAGYGGKWGAEMQNDLTDTVKYFIKEGIADPERVCIYGASYGGYATMAGLTFTPDLYKCGINYVGVTDVGLLFKTMPKRWEVFEEMMKIQIGDPDDKELMHRMSPLSHVDKITAPLMIVHGAKDPRVVKQHATDLRKALKVRGIDLSDDEWIMKYDEGHGFSKEENKIELYTKMEKFLAKHLK